MKLRNKKTGEVIDCDCIYFSCVVQKGHESDEFESIEQLVANWEDYTPQEPLIKDEKIRKCVKLWAEIQGIKRDDCVSVNKYPDAISILSFDLRHTTNIIFEGVKIDDGIDEHKDYTIPELCGEEE